MRRIPREALVLVADGGSARLFRNLGGENGAVRLHQEEALLLDPAEGVMPAVLPILMMEPPRPWRRSTGTAACAIQ